MPWKATSTWEQAKVLLLYVMCRVSEFSLLEIAISLYDFNEFKMFVIWSSISFLLHCRFSSSVLAD
jgi:hypothetical protein